MITKLSLMKLWLCSIRIPGQRVRTKISKATETDWSLSQLSSSASIRQTPCILSQPVKNLQYSFISVPGETVPGDDSCGCVVSTACQDVRCTSAVTAGPSLNDSTIVGDASWVDESVERHMCTESIISFMTQRFYPTSLNKASANNITGTCWCVKC